MDAEQSLLKLDAYCHFRQMEMVEDSDKSSHFLDNVMELTAEALASFKLAFNHVDIFSLKICSNILTNILNYIMNSSLNTKFHDVFLAAQDAYKDVECLLGKRDHDLVYILRNNTLEL